MKQVFFIHGGSAYTKYEDYLDDLRQQPLRSPSNHEEKKKWSKTLRAALGSDFEVFTPAMPNSNNSQYEEWKIWFEKHFDFLKDDLDLVCWSQGGMFIVKYLTENNTLFTISNLYLLAAPFDFHVDENSKEDGGDFYPAAELVKNLAGKVNTIHILHSKDDFIVPYEHALRYQEALPDATLHTFEDKNHFLIEEFPELVDLIKKL